MAASKLLQSGITDSISKTLQVETEKLRFVWLERNKKLLKVGALEVVNNLCCLPEGRQKVRKNRALMQELHHAVSMQRGQEIGYLASNILQMLCSSKPTNSSSSNLGKSAVFVSYSYQTAKMANLLMAELSARNFVVTNRLNNPSFESTIQAIDEADAAIICRNPDCPTSISLQLEAEYMSKIRKPIMMAVVVGDQFAVKRPRLLPDKVLHGGRELEEIVHSVCLSAARGGWIEELHRKT